MGSIQSYSLIYQPNDFTLKVCITQLEKDIDKGSQRKAFNLFVELMFYLEESIHSVIKLYLPSTKPPVLHVSCPHCNDTAPPHIMLRQVTKICLNLPVLFCTNTNQPLKLPRISYLPFGDVLSEYKFFGYYVQYHMIIRTYVAIYPYMLLRVV